MAEIYTINIKNGIREKYFKYFCQHISKEKQKKINRYIKVKDRERSLAAEILIRYIICKKMGLTNKDLLFSANEYGKPFLTNQPDFHYNIAHSVDWIVCVFDENEVGVDVERVRKIDLDVAKRFFTQHEYLDIISRRGEEAYGIFFELWTLKESYIKALGRGLSVSLKSFSFKLSDKNIIFQSENQNGDYQFKQYDIEPSYKMAVCIKGNSFPEKINKLDLSMIFHSSVII